MNTLIVNCGSSNLKFRLFQVHISYTDQPDFESLADGIIERIGMQGAIKFTFNNGESISETVQVEDRGGRSGCDGVPAGRRYRELASPLPVRDPLRSLDGLPGVPAQPRPREIPADR